MSEAGPTTITPEARADAPLSGATVVGVTAAFIGLCTVVVLARMAARFAVHQRLWWDDWTMVVAWIGMMGLCAQQLLMVQHGAGLHIQDVPKSELAQFTKVFSDYEIVARLSIFFAKLSILLLYIRVFFPPRAAKTALYWVIQAVIWLNLLYTISLILVVTLQCVPYGLPEGSTCVNEALVLIMASVINIVSDIAVLIIPLGAVWKLQVGTGKKWGLFALFAFGALAPLASIGRLGYQIPEADGKDKTVIYLIVVLLASAEQAIAIIVGSVPVASAWILRHKAKSSRYGGDQPRTFTERIRPSREQGSSGGEGSRGGTFKASRGAPDPYHLTNITLTGDSVEELHPRAAYLGNPSRNDKDDGYRYPQDEYQSWMIEDGRTYGLRTTTVHIESSPRY